MVANNAKSTATNRVVYYAQSAWKTHARGGLGVRKITLQEPFPAPTRKTSMLGGGWREEGILAENFEVAFLTEEYAFMKKIYDRAAAGFGMANSKHFCTQVNACHMHGLKFQGG